MSQYTQYLAARRKCRAVFLLAVLCCALLSLGCMTMTAVTGITRNDAGQTLVGQSLKLEFNKKLWDSLDPKDRQGFTNIANSLTQQGWKATSQEGGRIVDASRDPAPIETLPTKAWTYSEQKTQNGRIITLQSATDPSQTTGSTGSSNTDKTIVTIDESDPQTTHYKYQQSLSVAPPNDTSSGSQPPPSTGDNWGDFVSQMVNSSPQYKQMEQALKDAGPWKITMGVDLPGNIESANLNGSQGGTISGNHVEWLISGDMPPGQYNMEATASSSGAGVPGSFTAGLGCQYAFPDNPGQVVCAATVGNKPEDAEIAYEWRVDGQVQGTQGKTLTVQGISTGEHTVSVVAIATNKNNQRSDPASDSFTMETGAPVASAVPLTTTNGTGAAFSLAVGCNLVQGTDIACSVTPQNEPENSSLTYKWTVDGKEFGGESKSISISGPADGSHTITVSATDATSGKSASQTTTIQKGQVKTPWDSLPPEWQAGINTAITGKPSVDPPDLSGITMAGAATAIGWGAITLLGGIGGGAPAGAPAVPGGPPNAPTNQQGQSSSEATKEKKKEEEEQKTHRKLDPCQSQRDAMQSASSQARGLQNKLQEQRSQLNALEMRYEQTRKSMFGTGIIGIAAAPAAFVTGIWAALGGGTGASAALWTGAAVGSGTFTQISANSLADIRNQMNGVRQYVSDLDGQFDGARQAMDNARTNLNGCVAMHSGGGNAP